MLAKFYLSHCKHSYGEMYSLANLKENGDDACIGGFRIAGINPVSLKQENKNINTGSFDISYIALFDDKKNKWIRADIYIKALEAELEKLKEK